LLKRGVDVSYREMRPAEGETRHQAAAAGRERLPENLDSTLRLA
jgi:hypothetical protein